MSRRKVFIQYVDAIPDSSIKDHPYKRAGKTTDIQAFRDRTGKKNFHFDVEEFTKAEPNGDQWHVLEVQGAYTAKSKSVRKSARGGNQAKTSTYAMLRVHRDANPSPADFKEALKSAGSRCDEDEERGEDNCPMALTVNIYANNQWINEHTGQRGGPHYQPPQLTIPDPCDDLEDGTYDEATMKAVFAEAKRGKEKLQNDIQQKNDDDAEEEKKRSEDIAARMANRNLEKGKGKGKGKDTSGYR
ncbi:hypothetical protein H2201_004576 [Coniosporium apollinis]|uniref:Uncharacterized protein n=2 Tax=Coniosporium TaxID=2810619 RepID=A0ABQ9NVJ2_9PEZI|nr:hypothetical protein H2199_006756 [Cladosporium sp. JES 115]KAJ9665284.1 hypothetical protein H2201_004576 [Coniosporium apollinis]